MTDWHRVVLAISPHAKPSIVSMVADHADRVFAKYNINTPRRQAHLLAHMAVESQGFTRLHEDLDYLAQRLHEVWPSHFSSVEAASNYAHNPKGIALKVYGDRMGNRPGTMDGWTFAGSGLLQETGRENVERLGKKLGVTAEQAAIWLTDQDHALECAVAVFIIVGALPYADKDDIVGSTKHVNGGENGLADRRSALKRAYAALKKFASAQEETPEEEDTPVEHTQELSKADVRAVQKRLKELGFFPGTVDGSLGSLTRSAIRDFQDANGLKTDGQLDEATREKLSSAITSPKVMDDDRANATVDDLRQDGSTTIASADASTNALTKIGTTGAGALAVASTINDNVQSAKSIVTDNVSALTWFTDHWQLPVLVVLVSVAGYFIWRAYQAAEAVRQQRLQDHQSGAHLGR